MPQNDAFTLNEKQPFCQIEMLEKIASRAMQNWRQARFFSPCDEGKKKSLDTTSDFHISFAKTHAMRLHERDDILNMMG